MVAVNVKLGFFLESGFLEIQPKGGGKLYLRINTGLRPTTNKYRDGNLKSTLKRELNST